MVAEGIEGRVPYKGSLSGYIYQLVGGLRAGMGYCGVKTVEELRKNGQFVKVTHAGVQERHPQNIAIKKEAPNFSGASDNQVGCFTKANDRSGSCRGAVRFVA